VQLQSEAARALEAHIDAFSGLGEIDLRGVIISKRLKVDHESGLVEPDALGGAEAE
jgi:hypothetical protein